MKSFEDAYNAAQENDDHISLLIGNCFSIAADQSAVSSGQSDGDTVNGQVAVPGGGQLRVPTPRADHFLVRVVPPRARASRMR